MGASALAAAREHNPLIADLVWRSEELQTRSASVLRTRLYAFLAERGVRVDLLVRDARDRIVFRRKAKLKRSKLLNDRLAERIQSGAVATEKLPQLKMRLLGAPKRYKELEAAIDAIKRRPKQFATAPTQERRSQAGEDPKIIRTIPHAGKSSPRAHRFEAPLEAIQHKLTADEYNAADRLRWAFENRTARPSGSRFGDGFVVSDPATRLGITPQQQKAARRYNFVWPRVPAAFREIVRALVFQQPGRNEERAPTLIEWGVKFGGLKGKVRTDGGGGTAMSARLVATVALKLTCAFLAHVDRDYTAWCKQERELAEERETARFAQDRR